MMYLPFFLGSEQLSISQRYHSIAEPVENELFVHEFVYASLPLAQQLPEGARRRRRHLALVSYRHIWPPEKLLTPADGKYVYSPMTIETEPIRRRVNIAKVSE
jgi:hypothetical protein